MSQEESSPVSYYFGQIHAQLRICFKTNSYTSAVVCTMKCLCPPQHTDSTVWHSSFLVVSLTKKSPSCVKSLTTSSRGNTPWNQSSSTRGLFVLSDTLNDKLHIKKLNLSSNFELTLPSKVMLLCWYTQVCQSILVRFHYVKVS